MRKKRSPALMVNYRNQGDPGPGMQLTSPCIPSSPPSFIQGPLCAVRSPAQDVGWACRGPTGEVPGLAANFLMLCSSTSGIPAVCTLGLCSSEGLRRCLPPKARLLAFTGGAKSEWARTSLHFWGG